MVAAPAVAAIPLAEGAKLASSIVAQISAAMGTPLLKSEITTSKQLKHGTVTRTTVASIPAWVVVAGAGLVLVYVAVENRERATGQDPWSWLFSPFGFGLGPLPFPFLRP